MAQNIWERISDYLGSISPNEVQDHISQSDIMVTRAYLKEVRTLGPGDPVKTFEFWMAYKLDDMPDRWEDKLASVDIINGEIQTPRYIGGNKTYENEQQQRAASRSFTEMVEHLENIGEGKPEGTEYIDWKDAEDTELGEVYQQKNYHRTAAIQEGFTRIVNSVGHYAWMKLTDARNPAKMTGQIDQNFLPGPDNKVNTFNPDKIGEFGDFDQSLSNLYEELEDSFINFNGYVLNQEQFQVVQKFYTNVQDAQAKKYGLFSGKKKEGAINFARDLFRRQLKQAGEHVLALSPNQATQHYIELQSKYEGYSVPRPVQKTFQSFKWKVSQNIEAIEKLNKIEKEYKEFKNSCLKSFDGNADISKIEDIKYLNGNWIPSDFIEKLSELDRLKKELPNYHVFFDDHDQERYEAIKVEIEDFKNTVKAEGRARVPEDVIAKLETEFNNDLKELKSYADKENYIRISSDVKFRFEEENMRVHTFKSYGGKNPVLGSSTVSFPTHAEFLTENNVKDLIAQAAAYQDEKRDAEQKQKLQKAKESANYHKEKNLSVKNQANKFNSGMIVSGTFNKSAKNNKEKMMQNVFSDTRPSHKKPKFNP